jgi:hypothetical protein
MGIDAELDNVSVAPPGEGETATGGRNVEVPGEARDL